MDVSVTVCEYRDVALKSGQHQICNIRYVTLWIPLILGVKLLHI